MQIEQTSRGFAIVKWRDRYQTECSLQESSLASEDCIWLGAGEIRMHLTKEMVSDLLPFLQRFAISGVIHPSAE